MSIQVDSCISYIYKEKRDVSYMPAGCEKSALQKEGYRTWVLEDFRWREDCFSGGGSNTTQEHAV